MNYPSSSHLRNNSFTSMNRPSNFGMPVNGVNFTSSFEKKDYGFSNSNSNQISSNNNNLKGSNFLPAPSLLNTSTSNNNWNPNPNPITNYKPFDFSKNQFQVQSTKNNNVWNSV